MLKIISNPLKQLCMKCAEPCSGHCTHASHLVISVTKTLWFSKFLWLPKGSGQDPSTSTFPLREMGVNKAHRSCHSVTRAVGIKVPRQIEH